MHVLVTGGLGFIGAALAEHLLAQGARVTVADSRWFNGLPLDPPQGEEVAARAARIMAAGGQVREADLQDDAALAALLDDARPTHLAHLAGLSRADVARADPVACVHANVTLTTRLAARAKQAGSLRRFLLVSSSMVYGHFEQDPCPEAHACRPVDPYGATKRAAELVLHTIAAGSSYDTVILRPSVVYGPGDFNRRVTEIFVDNAMKGLPLVLNAGGLERLDFTFVTDAVAGMAGALAAPAAGGGTFNLASGVARSLEELATIVAAYRPGVTVERRPDSGDRPRRGALDIRRARAAFGYDPRVSLEEGVRLMFASRGVSAPNTSSQ